MPPNHPPRPSLPPAPARLCREPESNRTEEDSELRWAATVIAPAPQPHPAAVGQPPAGLAGGRSAGGAAGLQAASPGGAWG